MTGAGNARWALSPRRVSATKACSPLQLGSRPVIPVELRSMDDNFAGPGDQVLSVPGESAGGS